MRTTKSESAKSPTLSFGIITDTHVRSPEGDLSSPYPVNDKANDRARFACKLLAAQDPDFVIHLGDMVNPLPAMSSYDPACAEALRIFEPLKPKLHFVSGNHDVGDKPMPGSPAAIVNAEAMASYSSWFGEHWYSFDVEKLRIVVINSSLINTGSHAETEQNAWLESILTQSDNFRIILFSHYPLFVHDQFEPEHYDNIAEPGRSTLLNKIRNSSVDIVFSGHVHHFFYNQVDRTQFFILPGTSFTRQDYADLFKAGPAAEYGRDDEAKFSVAMVDVYPDNCQVRLISTGGQGLESNDAKTPELTAVKPSTKNITVSMRHPWHESIDLPFNGPMEEFTRKRVRNDYTVLRLMQMGINKLRIPMQDLIDDVSRKRVEDIISLGFSFTIICLQNAWSKLPAAISGIEHAIDAVEYILPNDVAHWKIPDNRSVVSVPVHLGFAASGAKNTDRSKPFTHTVSSGFPLNELDTVIEWQKRRDPQLLLNGIVVQIPSESSLTESINLIKGRLDTYPNRLIVNLKIAKINPAEESTDVREIGNRICTAIESTNTIDRLELQIDTFMSLDRGYSPRTGLVDRLTNLTELGQRIATLEM